MVHSIQEDQICASPAPQYAGMQQHTAEEATVAELSNPGCPIMETHIIHYKLILM
jgi:hypothetical protein